MEIVVRSTKKRQIIDITEQVEATIHGEGVITVFVKHTTAAITTADLDPGTDIDLLDALELMTPDKQWRHPHDSKHFPDHLWATLIGPSVTIPFKNSKLKLGTWQRIVLMEYDGPRERQIELTIGKV
jgi:secondary thiamine-phosphate synthase enzyme